MCFQIIGSQGQPRFCGGNQRFDNDTRWYFSHPHEYQVKKPNSDIGKNGSYPEVDRYKIEEHKEPYDAGENDKDE
jgi:hypothetical protein